MWHFTPESGAAQYQQPDPGNGQKVHQRVLCISIALGVYIIVAAILGYCMDIVAVDSLMVPFQDALHMHGLNLTMIAALKGLPSMVINIGLSLLVPLCGYLGSKQRHSCLLCCFTCCNIFGIVTGTCAFLGMMAFMVGTTTFASGAEAWMVKCDPYQCMPLDEDTNQTHVVDCLATGVWPETYTKKFPEDPSLPEDCFHTWLQCDPEAGEMEGPMPWKQHAFRHSGMHSAPSVPEEMQPWARFQHQERRLSLVDHEEHQEHHDGHHNGNHKGRHNYHHSSSSSSSSWQQQPRRFRSGPYGPHGPKNSMIPPQPKDVLASCKPFVDSIKNFHKASKMVPELVPKFEGLLFVKAMLILPAIIISCLGCVWGKEAHSHAQQHPVQFFHPSQVMMQPALGTVVATINPADASMDQPLMLRPPTAPAS